jgi:dipeptidyl-peptidase III
MSEKFAWRPIALAVFLIAFLPAIWSCRPAPDPAAAGEPFEVVADRFADVEILRYEVPGFERLSPLQKELVYYLYKAALSGRDILWDQHYRHNLLIRRTLEAINGTYTGDRNSPDFQAFLVYSKRVWFSNGIHHHYSYRKFEPGFTPEYFTDLINHSDPDSLPLVVVRTPQELLKLLIPVLFDPELDAVRVSGDPNTDLIANSANNLYRDVNQAEVEAFYAGKRDARDTQPPWFGLNSRLVKESGTITEQVYRSGGLYGPAIDRIVHWLEKALGVAENQAQRDALELLIEYYRTGDLRVWDEYNIAWLRDTASVVDVVNGFIEVYGDPLGLRGAWESVVSIRDFEASERMAALARNAQWFEDNLPTYPYHRRERASGISYKVITVVAEGGDAAPATPIGINLPNSNWIRTQHGSKSVSLGNITEAYGRADGGGTVDEFYYTPEERARIREQGSLAGKMRTALHEVIGHASGKLEEGIGNPGEALKNYGSAIEEARADLVALYYLLDPHLVELGLIPSLETGKAEYDRFIKNGLQLQLRRLEAGAEIQQAHMRNRQMVSAWAYERGQTDGVIERIADQGKTYFVVRDYEKLRQLFGVLLKEVQRIKSQGDFEAARQLVETYGVRVDQEMLREVKERFAHIESAPYAGFIQPRLVPVVRDGKITDVRIEYPDDFVSQMMEYGASYSFLPDLN